MVRLVYDSPASWHGPAYEMDDDLEKPALELDLEQPGPWSAVEPPEGAAAHEALFVDGVQRVDGHVVVVDGARSSPALAGSYAAGAVRHTAGRAAVEQFHVRRMLFAQSTDMKAIDCGSNVVYSPRAVSERSPEGLRNALTKAMRGEEKLIASTASAELVVIDGPLSGDPQLPGAVGLVKSHHQRYLDEGGPHDRLVTDLAPGQRTPVFLIQGRYPRYSWYLRLPGPVAHPWSGIVRCETSGAADPPEVIRRAGVTAATLPRFASSPHRDPRAPQNLTPVGELERQLRHRLGDPRILERMLRRTCAAYTA